MPWGAMPVMELRREFCALASVEGANIRLLCWRFQVAPKTGYKWLERYREAGYALAPAAVESGAEFGGDRACGA